MDKRLLIVDDEQVNREILKKCLGDKYSIVEAVDGEDAIKKIKEFGLELSMILLDVFMPRKDGFAVLEYLNEWNYIGSIPVVLITADTETSHEEKAFNLGVSDFITKPFNSNIVVKRIENIVNLFESTKELRMMIEEQQMTIMQQMEEEFE